MKRKIADWLISCNPVQYAFRFLSRLVLPFVGSQSITHFALLRTERHYFAVKSAAKTVHMRLPLICIKSSDALTY